jgi:deoxyxylulose-5-phosphate synthase
MNAVQVGVEVPGLLAGLQGPDDVRALPSSAGVPVALVDPRWVRPLDPAMVAAAAHFPIVVTVEDNAPSGGFGDVLARSLREAGATPRLRTLTLPADFVGAGSREEVLHAHGLDAEGIVRAVLDVCSPVASRVSG